MSYAKRKNMFSYKKSFLNLKILPAVVLGVMVGAVGLNGDEVWATTSSLSVSVTAGANPSVSLPQTSEGRFVASSATTFKVTTTHAAGYTMTAKATALTSGSNTISTLSSGTKISEDTFRTNNSYNNKWGFKPSTYYSGTKTESNTNYMPAPLTTTTLAKTTDKTSGTYNISFGVRANNSTAEGAYTSTLTVAVTANVTPYTIKYVDASGEASGMPSSNSGTSSSDKVNVSSTTPTRSGYTFKGWCSVATSNSSCSGMTYSAGGSYSLIDQTSSSNSLTLYAIWEALSGKTINDLQTMQDFASLSGDEIESVKASMDEGGEYSLYDDRDGKKYYITRYGDGNIWMTQNLDFDLNNHGEYYPSDTDVSSVWDLDTRTYQTDDTSWNDSAYKAESYDPGDLCWTGTFDSGSNGGTLDDGGSALSCGNLTDGPIHEHIGNYYNWTAAVAMDDSSSYTIDNTDVDQSICPAGWRLPTLAGNYSYEHFLGELYGTSPLDDVQNPFYFVPGGNWIGTSKYVNRFGFYWTSTVSSEYEAYGMYLSNDENFSYQFIGDRSIGASVRCVVRNETMQTVSDWGSNLDVGDTIKARDTRDGKSYLVTRLADDNIWMTQNLDLDLDSNATYTSEDTDISNDWTPSTSTYASSDTTWNATESTPESYDPGDLCWNGTISTSGGTLDTMTTKCSESSANKHWSVGNYYNWTAAVAMNDSSSYTTGDTDVDQSICPAGWRLPTVSDNYSFQKLLNESGYSVSSGTSGNIQSDPFYFVCGGYWGGSSGSVGRGGYYWSSVVINSILAYVLNFDANGYLNPQYIGSRNYGFSMRCVAR